MEKVKKNLFVVGGLCGKVTTIGTMVVLAAYILGLGSNISLDLIERHELKKRIKNINNNNK